MQQPNRSSRMTGREQQVIRYLCHGYTSKQIGNQLQISHLTVEKHKKNLLDKFQANSSAHLVYLIMNQNLLEF